MDESSNTSARFAGDRIMDTKEVRGGTSCLNIKATVKVDDRIYFHQVGRAIVC